MFLFCMYNMIFVFHMDMFWGDVVYLLYSGLASVMFGLFCGTVSLTSSFLFVDYIYRTIKSD